MREVGRKREYEREQDNQRCRSRSPTMQIPNWQNPKIEYTGWLTIVLLIRSLTEPEAFEASHYT